MLLKALVALGAIGPASLFDPSHAFHDLIAWTSEAVRLAYKRMPQLRGEVW